MITNYFKTAFRNIKKHKSFTAINLSGLAIGMACCILLSLFINSELSFDDYHKKPLPFLPRHISLITSAEGAAIHDFITSLNKRHPGCEINVFLV